MADLTEPTAAAKTPLTRRQAYEAQVRRRSVTIAGLSTAAVLISLIILIPLAPGWEAVKKSFFNPTVFAKTFPGLLEAFLLDVAIFAWSAPLIFILGLAVAFAAMRARQRCIRFGFLASSTPTFFAVFQSYW